ncbi:BrnT family toxin [Duganella sp. CT11-25]|jgi:uncharacterized DUF497 family protein|uniref:BrnT family toxin n=1 Tax=unclassified Duganella TaxID=2636909 RepID=UPI0039B0A59A
MTSYTWDEKKRLSNLRKHGLDFANASAVFAGRTFTTEDTRVRYGERRFITIGHFAGREVAVTYTERNDDIRIISFRKANREERETLFIYGR